MVDQELFQVIMPEVDVREGLEVVFDRARDLSSQETTLKDGSRVRRVMIITPGRLLIEKESYPDGLLPDESRTMLEELLPSNDTKNIAVIAYTYLDALRENIRKAIPFIDYLLGFAYLGHNIWIFEGHISALKAGCKGADLVMIDSRMVKYLDPNWESILKDELGIKNIRILSLPE